MKYIKTYENFNYEPMNEGVFGDIWNWIKSKIGDLVDYLGDKYNQFVNAIEKLCDSIANVVGDKVDEVADNLEKMFGPLNSLDFANVKDKIELKFGNQIEKAVREHSGKRYESHMEQEAGQGNVTTNLPKDSGIVQTVLAILQNIFAFNLFSCGIPIAVLLGYLMPHVVMGTFVFMLASFIITAIALAVIVSARKLVYNMEHGDKKLATKPLVGDSRFNPDKLKNNKSIEGNFLQTKTNNSDDATRW